MNLTLGGGVLSVFGCRCACVCVHTWFGWWVCGHGAVFGRTLNPWNPDYTPGGSSGGEACLLAERGIRLVHSALLH